MEFLIEKFYDVVMSCLSVEQRFDKRLRYLACAPSLLFHLSADLKARQGRLRYTIFNEKQAICSVTHGKNKIAVIPYLKEILERCRFCWALVDEERDFGEADCQPLKQEPRRVE